MVKNNQSGKEKDKLILQPEVTVDYRRKVCSCKQTGRCEHLEFITYVLREKTILTLKAQAYANPNPTDMDRFLREVELSLQDEVPGGTGVQNEEEELALCSPAEFDNDMIHTQEDEINMPSFEALVSAACDGDIPDDDEDDAEEPSLTVAREAEETPSLRKKRGNQARSRLQGSLGNASSRTNSRAQRILNSDSYGDTGSDDNTDTSVASDSATRKDTSAARTRNGTRQSLQHRCIRSSTNSESASGESAASLIHQRIALGQANAREESSENSDSDSSEDHADKGSHEESDTHGDTPAPRTQKDSLQSRCTNMRSSTEVATGSGVHAAATTGKGTMQDLQRDGRKERKQPKRVSSSQGDHSTATLLGKRTRRDRVVTSKFQRWKDSLK